MTQEIVNQQIRVMAEFRGGKVKPLVFEWGNKSHRIKAVTLAFQERDGASMNYYFSVETATGGVFKLHYNDQKLLWWLDEAWVE